ncbi:hypothetical protein G647_04849 [Cladophialophora carrionii CBS 160.54]|uniref:Major facilitator superfamily (MFS) profile domain-containing protein n=1 Tax=Cladophialophora carrionii CBS 160.54 TaxID=1279043 RepID=V9D9S9_9EURO|nr:uncharacterized protein G647_04849 [Cladophialophora carrionii CBS 160.54]ETI23053.1 hypothetical protein G647_04849 [Cladophialophora carrionii CBS 160.54]
MAFFRQSFQRDTVSLAGLCVVVLTESIDATSIAVALPTIAEAVSASTTAAYSLGTSFLVALTLCQPVFASGSDVFGRKPALLCALVVFLAGAVVAAVSKNVAVLLLGRVLQGSGGAGVMVLAVIVLSDIFPLGERAKYVGVMNAVWAVGSVSGPVLGGALAQVSWRWIFWINIPLVVLSITSIAAFLPRRAADIPLWTKLGHIDYVGIVMFLTFGVSFFLPLVFAGIIRPWSSWEILVPLLVGIAGMVLFLGYEKKVAKEPMLRLAVFANRTANVGQFGIFVHGVLLWTLVYYLPLYYEGVKGYSPLITGLAVFPETFTVAPAAVVTGFYISSTGQYRWAVWAGWFLTTLGYGLLCLLKPGTTVPSWIFLNLVAGLGVGMLVPALSITVQAATQGTNVSHTISMYALVRASGQACGVAIGTAIFQTQCKSVLAGMSGVNLTAEALIREIQQFSGTPDQLDELQEAVVRSVRIVWASGCAMAALAGVASIWIKPYALRSKPQAGEAGVETAAS